MPYTTDTWIGQKCVALATQAVQTPDQPYTDGSYFVQQYALAAPIVYKAGGDAKITYFNECIVSKAVSNGMSQPNADALGMRLSELGQRYKMGGPTRTAARSTTLMSRAGAGPIVSLRTPPKAPPIQIPGTKGSGGAAATPEVSAADACAQTGGIWDVSTTSCLPATRLDEQLTTTGQMDFPRVRRSALGYDYFALDIPPESEPAALAALSAFWLSGPGPGSVPGVEFWTLGIEGSVGSVPATDWIGAQRAAGLGIVGVIGTGAQICATNDVSVASSLTLANEAGAVLFEPSAGWTAPGAGASKTTMYVVAGVAGAAVIGGLVWYGSRKQKITKNPRYRTRRRRRR
jgi:hypothetical protein